MTFDNLDSNAPAPIDQRTLADLEQLAQLIIADAVVEGDDGRDEVERDAAPGAFDWEAQAQRDFALAAEWQARAEELRLENEQLRTALTNSNAVLSADELFCTHCVHCARGGEE